MCVCVFQGPFHLDHFIPILHSITIHTIEIEPKLDDSVGKSRVQGVDWCPFNPEALDFTTVGLVQALSRSGTGSIAIKAWNFRKPVHLKL